LWVWGVGCWVLGAGCWVLGSDRSVSAPSTQHPAPNTYSAVSVPAVPAVLVERPPDPFGRERQIGDVDADGVGDGGLDGGRGGADRRLADALDAERSVRRGDLDVARDHLGRVHRRRDAVVREVGVGDAAVLVLDLLHPAPGEALDGAAL